MHIFCFDFVMCFKFLRLNNSRLDRNLGLLLVTYVFRFCVIKYEYFILIEAIEKILGSGNFLL